MRKRLEHIRTMRNQVSRFRAQSPHGALLSLAQLSYEKELLQQEKRNWAARMEKIEARLKEIAEREEWLHAMAHSNTPPPGPGKRKGQENSANPGSLPPGFSELTVKY